MDIEQIELLKQWESEANDAGHPFPEAAACEAALESAYGKSYLAIHGLNLFGMKQHKEHLFETLTLPTREATGKNDLLGNPIFETIEAPFIKYPTLKDCFADRLATLKRLQDEPDFTRYKIALNATTPEDFIVNVSKKWSTDPNRGAKVLSILKQFQEATVTA
jgi:flagellum-specific peptidoglycan hydrolase FlgJ